MIIRLLYVMPLQTRCNGLFKQHFSLDRRIKGKIVTTQGNHKGLPLHKNILYLIKI
ncbi:MAG: hypothetical protein KAI83_00310 [Thiomargarita sp.]|nr:hypothetical protein [Thiomargarita sp.]